MEKRVYNFSPGPAVLPLPVSKRPSAICLPCPARGLDPGNQPSLEDLRCDHQPGRGQPPQPAGHPRQLPGLVPPRRGPPPVRHGPHELAARHGQAGRLHRHRLLGEEGRRGGQDPGHRPLAWDGKADQLQPHAQAGRAEARPRRRLRLHDLERDDPGRAVSHASRRWAACRWSATRRPISSAGRCRSSATASFSPVPRRTPGRRG